MDRHTVATVDVAAVTLAVPNLDGSGYSQGSKGSGDDCCDAREHLQSNVERETSSFLWVPGDSRQFLYLQTAPGALICSASVWHLSWPCLCHSVKGNTISSTRQNEWDDVTASSRSRGICGQELCSLSKISELFLRKFRFI